MVKDGKYRLDNLPCTIKPIGKTNQEALNWLTERIFNNLGEWKPLASRKQLPTAKGYHFITLEDGLINVIVRSDMYTVYKPVLRESPLLNVTGIIQ